MARNKHPEITIGRILDVSSELFLKKGYENTTIQDILDSLHDLSKGAIYHHFKSKEEIANGVLDRILGHSHKQYTDIISTPGLNAVEKLRKLFLFSLSNTKQDVAIQLIPTLLKDPKFLAMQIDTSVNEVAPLLIEPLIREGIKDGSISTEYPKELAEVLILIANIWLNPLVFNDNADEVYQKCMFFNELLLGYGIVLIDDEIVQKITQIKEPGACKA